MNPYITQIPPYMSQDAQGLGPVFQNIGAQQQYLNQQLAQNNQMAQPQQYRQSFSGISPMELAKMLRQGGGASPMDKAINYFGTQQTPEMQAQINQLGSNTYNPLSDYNTGANGWGSFGE